MEITIDQEYISTLNRIASSQNMTPEEFASNFLTKYLFSEYKNKLLTSIENQPIESLKVIEQSVDSIINKIKTIDAS